jgi:hypothetical protein
MLAFRIARLAPPLVLLAALGCATDPPPPAAATTTTASVGSRTPSPAVQAWMDRLTVAHHFDPATGFIVADEVVALPAPLRDAPPLDEAAATARAEGRILIVFTTADRCGPCQQFKRDTLNDPGVIAALADPRFLAVHVEVDRETEAVRRVLGETGIPASSAWRDGAVVSRLPGQRSPADVLTWLADVR